MGQRRFVDETYVKVAGVWRYVCRAIDERGQVIDVPVSRCREITAARTFFAAMRAHAQPDEVITDSTAGSEHVIAERLPDTGFAGRCDPSGKAQPSSAHLTNAMGSEYRRRRTTLAASSAHSITDSLRSS